MRIKLTGASEHNLQEVDAEFVDGLTVVTGVSGSGKTSLVFDTLYHEARRHFLEIFSLGSNRLRLAPARVSSISGLGPAVAVGQNLLNRNPNSTLATASGLHPLLRLLYARFGEPACARCGARIHLLSPDELVEALGEMARQAPVTVLAPLVNRVPGSHAALLRMLAAHTIPEDLIVDGAAWNGHALDAGLPHTIDIRLDSITDTAPVTDLRKQVENAAAWGASAVRVKSRQGDVTLSFAPVCVECGAWFTPVQPTDFHSPCPSCRGTGCARCGQTGIEPQAAAVRWNGLRLTDLLALDVDEVVTLLTRHPLPVSAARLQVEISSRLESLQKVGVGYLALNRPAPGLSRGEAQRLRLAVCLTSRLEDMLHVLDEPTVGLHPADVLRLLPVLRQLPGPVVFVEHDRLAAALADQAIDLGPGAGSQGGRVIFSGSPAQLWQQDSPTGRAFSLRDRSIAPVRRPPAGEFLLFHGALTHNLRDLDIPIPLGRMTVVTGVSGSGKSTLVEDVIYASLAAGKPVGCRSVDGPSLKATLVDQSPIGRNPRSNPATYTKLADLIRDSFAAATGLSASHFSFNRPQGACPVCQGIGSVEVAMRYLPSTWIPCAECDGQRFSEEVLAARADFSGQHFSIAEFYELSIRNVLPLIKADGRLSPADRRAAGRILDALVDIGLGYLPLGQPSPTLSGGEAQRVKLARYLGKPGLASDLLILDEPSTGLHPADIAGLQVVLDRLVSGGATVLIVEHNTDIMRAADWIIDLGPGSGASGGRLLYAGPLDGLYSVEGSLTARALKDEDSVLSMPHPERFIQPDPHRLTDGYARAATISIRGARTNNLKNVDVDFPKGALTVVTGVSGSGKSSLVTDILEAEARRRFLETLAMYERQSTREGSEAVVDSVSGLGVAVSIGTDRRLYERRATVGSATEISHHLAVLFSAFGERACPTCAAPMRRQLTEGKRSKVYVNPERYSAPDEWVCPVCGVRLPVPRPRHFSPGVYAAACLTCHGVGTIQEPAPEKLITHPEKPLTDGAMYSPGFFPAGYLGKPFNGGYDMLLAMAARYQFDPATTPWEQMSPSAQHAFLFGDPDPMLVHFTNRSGREHTRLSAFPGFYGWVRDWDVGGTYTRTRECPECRGAGLRPDYNAVTLGGHSLHALKCMPLKTLTKTLDIFKAPVPSHPALYNLATIQRRLRFLIKVGLGYLTLNRVSATLSAGEAQRIKLAGLLGSGLTSLTVLLDEPTRGLHPSEVGALLDALKDLRDEGDTVITVEHDLQVINAADYLIDVGPGAGASGGQIVAQGTPRQVAANTASITGAWLRGESRLKLGGPRRSPAAWMEVRGAHANNLRGETVGIPLGVLVGVCGVSGSGKSTLLIDTLGRALAPKKHTTSVAREPIDPGPYDAIQGAPMRTVIVDQTREGVESPAAFLELEPVLRGLFAKSEDAKALSLTKDDMMHACSACGGRGAIRTDMEFLPPIDTPCELCQGSGLRPEAGEVRLNGISLPELYRMTIDQVFTLFKEEPTLAGPLDLARRVGLGYLVLRQPAYSLSGGEAQRLKIARELRWKSPSSKPSKKARGAGKNPAPAQTLYILDEPSVGQSMEDVSRLIEVLHDLVEAGGSVVVIEHHPHILAACDWLIELGPGGGPEGGSAIASGTPETVAASHTPTSLYLREALKANR
jgi:excinuclease ABC subunit A